MKAKLHARTDFQKIEKNPIQLIEAIKQHAMSYESTQYRMKTILEAMRSYVNLKQKDGESILDYLRRSKAAEEVFYSHVGKNFFFPKLLDQDQDYDNAIDDLKDGYRNGDQNKIEASIKEKRKIETKMREEFSAYVYLANVDMSKYGTLVAGLDTQYSLGQDQYPKSRVDAHQVVSNHPWDPGYKKNQDKRREKDKKDGKPKSDDADKPVSMTFNQMKKKNVCYCCGEKHQFQDCPKKDTTPRTQWYINQNSEAIKYNAMVAEIRDALAPAGSQAPSTASVAASTAASTVTDPTESWHFFTFQGAGVKTDEFRDSIVLDSASSVDLFCNKKLLQNIGPSDHTELVHTNAGTLNIDKQGTLPEYGVVPYQEDGLTNILSLAMLTDKYRVTFDSAKDNAFYVHTPKATVRFARNESNLYSHQPKMLRSGVQTPGVHKAITAVQTVDENKKFHTPREVKRAKKARDLLAALGSPSIFDLKAAIAMNAIADLPVTTEDVKLAERIFGPDLGTLKGKTTRQKPVPMVENRIEIPPELYEKRESLELCLDLMFANGMAFMTSITRALYYRTANFIPSREKDVLYKHLDQILRLYNSNGFEIKKIYCDNEFRSIMDEIKDNIDGITFDYSPAKAHVPEAERNNRVLKERVRAAFHRLPYKALPRILLKYLVSESARKLNYFPAKYGISQHYSPRQIVHQETLDYKSHCLFPFGSYVQAHDEPDPRNTQEPRTRDAIYLRPIKNSHELYDLETREIINRPRLTMLPVTPSVIAAVEKIAAAEGQKGLRIKSLDGTTLYDTAWTAGVDYDEDESDEEFDSDEEFEDDELEDEECSTTDEETDSGSEDDEDSDEAQDLLYGEGEDPVQADASEAEEEDEQDDEEEPDEGIPEIENEPLRRSTRTRTAPEVLEPTMRGQIHGSRSNHQHLQVPEVEATEYDEDIARYAVSLLQALKERTFRSKARLPRKKRQGCFLVTYSLQKGIKKFKRKGFDAAKGEMKQLHDRECWSPILVSSMTPSEKRKALESLIFLVEKKDGKIKARHCANGSKQRQWMRPDEAASPTVMTESIMLTAAIEAKERRDVATFDIPNAFIQTLVDKQDEQGDRIIMKIRGAMIDMLLEIDKDYKKFVAYENGQRVLYVHIQRAIYGMLMSGLLFYKKFRASIEKIGYEVNPYDPCVANKMINGKQHTISWHVDDLKSSHVDPKVNDDFHAWLQKEYGQVKEVTAHRGTRHVYLGMTLDYSTPGEVKVDMVDYVKEMIDEFPSDLDGKVATVANEKLFDTSRGKKLGPLRSDIFHATVAKALFLTLRARPDIRLAVAFLCTRVKEPTNYDWFKLTRMMNFLKRTEKDCLTLEIDESNSVVWSIDAAFAVHPDMKSHTGMTMTMGGGAITSLSKKQKLNTRSSTEAELVAVDDCMSQVLWTKYFLEAQGYSTKPQVVLQDNESAIKLEKNGHKSMGQRSRHIEIRYFFVTDRVQKGDLEIRYCPTDKMEGDYMSKALQGSKFHGHRKSIMNIRDSTPNRAQ